MLLNLDLVIFQIRPPCAFMNINFPPTFVLGDKGYSRGIAIQSLK